jgi:hypothetical protein
MKKSFWPIMVSVCLISAQLLAQQAAEDSTIRVTARLVQINVVVHDKNGALVRDLTKDDFAVFDKGQEQKILFFSKKRVASLCRRILRRWLRELSPTVSSMSLQGAKRIWLRYRHL